MEYYAAIKKNKTSPYGSIWKDLNVPLSEEEQL